MPKATVGSGASNALADLEGASPSAGTSSSTSDVPLDKSGPSSGTDPQSPAPDAESLSAPDPAARPISSSVASTGTSGQGTSSDPARQPGSSVESLLGTAPTQGQDPRADWTGGPSEADPQLADS